MTEQEQVEQREFLMHHLKRLEDRIEALEKARISDDLRRRSYGPRFDQE